LYFDGHSFLEIELAARWHLLESLIDTTDVIRLSDEVDADGDALLRSACEHGLEGIIARDRNSPYRSGRGGEWVKIKCIQSESFAIVGYEQSISARAGIGALLLAARHAGKLVYVGSVGAGFKEAATLQLREKLDRLKTEKPAVDHAIWVAARFPTWMAVPPSGGKPTISCSRAIRTSSSLSPVSRCKCGKKVQRFTWGICRDERHR